MKKQIEVDEPVSVDHNEQGVVHELTETLAYQRLSIVNVVYYGRRHAGDRNWVLIDTGVWGSAQSIRRSAAERFGEGARPAAIILTHGHFDHVGCVMELAEEWQVPVYAHELELPHLNGELSYPMPDPSVGGGLMAALSGFYPRKPINVGHWLRKLEPHELPGMPGWEWIETPGHTAGHVSLWNAGEKLLIAGDAFITTKQESAYAVFLQRPELHGPPQYFMPDWETAEHSVKRLASLRPEFAVSGHGRAMYGHNLREALDQLADRFAEVAVPH